MPESISSTGSGEQLFFLITFMLKLKNDLAVKKKKNPGIIPTPDLKS